MLVENKFFITKKIETCLAGPRIWEFMEIIKEKQFTKNTTGSVSSLDWIFYKLEKIDGVGPVDNRPSTDKLHHFFREKKKNNNYM